MNKVVLVGRLTRDPEARYTQSGLAVTTFTLAVDRRRRRDAENNGQPTADFIPIVTWDKLAEICANNLSKGRQIAIEGRIQTRSYEAQDGTKRYVTEVIANEMEFCGSKQDYQSGDNYQGGYQNSGGGYQGGGGYNNNRPAQASAPANDGGSFGPPIPDEEIPF